MAASEQTPPPGSDAALAQGCRCPVMDNAHGAGIPGLTGDGTPLYWISAACPLHGQPAPTPTESEGR